MSRLDRCCVSACRGGRAGERGSSTIWVLGLGAVVFMVGLATMAMGAADVVQHRADVAAELAALSAVPRAADGTDAACALAAEIAGEHDATLRSCAFEGREVEVVVEAGRELFGWSMVAHARSRAAPSSPGQSDGVPDERSARTETVLPGRPPVRIDGGS